MSSQEPTVASFPVIVQALKDKVKDGHLSYRQARRLAGWLVLSSGGAGDMYSRRTTSRRRAELRAAGFILAESPQEPRTDEESRRVGPTALRSDQGVCSADGCFLS